MSFMIFDMPDYGVVLDIIEIGPLPKDLIPKFKKWGGRPVIILPTFLPVWLGWDNPNTKVSAGIVKVRREDGSVVRGVVFWAEDKDVKEK